jgi:hypothetical protein
MFLALVLATISSSAADVYLGQAKVFYQNLDYEKCLKRLSKARTSATASDDSASIALYTGLCSAGLNRADEAKAAFVLAGKLNPALELPPGASPKVRELFQAAVPRVEPPSAPVAAAPQPPVEPVLQPKLVPSVAPTSGPPPSAVTTPIARKAPVLGLVTAGLSLAALGVGIGFGVSAQNTAGQARMAMFDSDMKTLSDRAISHAIVANVMYISAGVMAVVALIGFLVN